MSKLEDFKELDLGDSYIAEYVWIDGNYRVRSKARTLTKVVTAPSELPEWNYDGSSTGQAPGADSEVILKPEAIYKDPFRKGTNILVLCDCYTPAGEPIPTNQRFSCDSVMEKAKDLVPWFGIEQEYFMFDPATKLPIGFPADGTPPTQGPYYCGVGAGLIFGRDVCDAHYKACLYAGIKISGINGEVAPGQWEYQVGPCTGIEEGDSLWMSRYILERVAEIGGVTIVYDPKPVKGDVNGSGGHTNFSTKPMREEGGFENHIKPALEKLGSKHKEHIAAYGDGNDERMTGLHETASIDKFSWGTADRGASCRVGHETANKGYGYFEDRRPAANLDPYVVTKMIVATTCDIEE